MSITINGSGDINSSGNDIELQSTSTQDVTLALGGGSVGIGTATPSRQLSIIDSTNPFLQLALSTDTAANNGLEIVMDANGAYFQNRENTPTIFSTNNTERARIDSSGNLLVGKTAAGAATAGFETRSSGYTAITRDGGQPLEVRRLTSNGVLVDLRKDSSTVGNISTDGRLIIYDATAGGIRFGATATNVMQLTPTSNSGVNLDNTHDIGASSVRWDDIYATNSVIQTSDANEKQDVAELDEAEKRVATAAKGLIRKFRWIDSVEEKGDDARIHLGIIAQDLKAAFEAEGLDPGRYAMFISSTWWEADETYTDDEGVEQTRTNTYETAEEAPEGAVERTRLGIRYNQLLAFIIGAL